MNLSYLLPYVRYRKYTDTVECYRPEEIQTFLSRRLSTQALETPYHDWTSDTPPTTPNQFILHDHDSTTDYPQEDSIDLDPCSDGVLESARTYDSDCPCSPTLSNKGVPNMFPVTESDFQSNYPSDQEDSPLPYGSPISSYHGRSLDPVTVECQGAEGSSPANPLPAHPRSPEPYARPFAFYHHNVRLGQTQQFSTFERK